MNEANSSEPANISACIVELGEAGQRLTEIDASEGAAGNLSIYLHGPAALPPQFNCSEVIALPLPVPELSGGWFIATGSGTRSREIRDKPLSCLGCIEVHPGGESGTLWHGQERRFARLTSELNSHMAVHRDHIARHGHRFHAVVHAQPRKITYLSHIDIYQDPDNLNRRLLRWQPEAILNFPEGIAVLPFLVPGQAELMRANATALRESQVVVWAKHGVMARSSSSVLAAVDLIEYLETAATYECLDRVMGSPASGLTPEDMRSISQAYGIEQKLF